MTKLTKERQAIAILLVCLNKTGKRNRALKCAHAWAIGYFLAQFENLGELVKNTIFVA